MRTVLTCGLLLLAAVSAQPGAVYARAAVPNLTVASLQMVVLSQRAEGDDKTSTSALRISVANLHSTSSASLPSPAVPQGCELSRAAGLRAP